MWASDTIDDLTKYLAGNRYAQVLSNGTLFSDIYHTNRKLYSGIALKTFITELGVPGRITIDSYKEHNAPGTDFMKIFQRNNNQVKITEKELLN